MASSSGEHQSSQVVGLLVIAAVAVAAVVVAISRQDGSSGGDGRLTSQTNTPSTPPQAATDVGERDVRAIATLSEQERALARGSAASYASTWDRRGAAQRRAAATYANLRALRVDHLNPRYVASDVGGLTADEQRRLGGSAWTADVDIAWRLSGVDRSDATTTLTYTFVRRAGEVRVAEVDTADGAHEPVWLLGRLHVRRSERTVVAATNRADARQLDRALRRAVDDVGRVIPSWRGELVAYGPSTVRQFDSILAAAPGAYEGIAAVTTTIDGSRQADAPVAIVINPSVFAGLGPIGAHVVVTHESTHVATDATTVSMPLWIAEGFADYVGVGAVDVPLSVSARVAFRDVRSHGLPASLPTDAEFRGEGGDIELAYEQAWLATRVIARDFGERRLVAFYQDVVHRPDAVPASLRDNLGTTRPALTQAWRAYLKELAGGR